MAVEASINYLAVLAASVVSMALGFLWYGPLFGKAWISMMGFGKKEVEESKKKGMWKTYAISFATTFIMAYVLAHFVDYMEAGTFFAGVTAGIWVWIGFVATIMLGIVLWEGKPVKLYLLNTLHYLVSLAVMGGILAVW